MSMLIEEIVKKWGGVSESPMDLYTDVFKLGEGYIQKEWEVPGEFKSNPIIIGHADNRNHRYIMFEDTFKDTLDKFYEYEWAYMSGCTYFGRCNTSEYASKLYALIFDLDGVTDKTINNFFSGAIDGGAYPVPQHIVLSGHGVHLYYVFEEPLSLYPNIKTQVKDLKYALTRRLWNQYTSTIEKPQIQGINQSFRVAGSKTKLDAPYPICKAYRVDTHPISIEELSEYVPEECRVDLSKKYPESKYTLEDAKSKFPEWYERVIVNKEEIEKGQWVVKEDLYSWWLKKLTSGEVSYGHRYFTVMALAIYAAKCGIYEKDRVYKDACSLIPYYNTLNPEHPFTKDDIKSALECLDSRYVRFPRKDIQKLTAIQIPENKRNGRKQVDHVKLMSMIRDFDDPEGNWRNKDGAPDKKLLIQDYAFKHPEATYTTIARELNVSRATVYKWLKGDWKKEYIETLNTPYINKDGHLAVRVHKA